MAFKIVNNEVITDGLDGQLDNLIVDGVNVLAGDGAGNVTLQNVIIDASSIDTSSLTTDDIAEGSNFYYTDVRVQNYLTTNSYATESYVDQAELDAISSANTYTDSRETSIVSYVDSQDSATLASAQAYTDSVIDSGFTSTDYIGFDLTAGNPVHNEGYLFYDADAKALSYYNDSVDVTVNLGRELLIRVYNNTGTPITNGQAVYLTGAFNDVPTVSLSNASTIVSAKVDGIATEDIANGEIGYITRNGTVNDVSTFGYTVGDRLYLSDAADGAWTTTPPGFPSYTVEVGVVTIVDAAIGAIEVNIHTHAFEDIQVDGQADFEIGLTSHADVDMLNNNINNVASPTTDDQAVNKLYSDTNLTTAQAYTDAAEVSANSYTDGEITTLTSYVDTQDSATLSSANSYTDAQITALGGSISGITTDDVTEASNLYYTDARARASISVTGAATYDDNTGVINVTGGVTSVNTQTGDVVLTTSEVTEGTNLYYTTLRANADFDARLATKTTDDLTEGLNLYYTDARANSAIDARVDTAFVDALNVTAAAVQTNSVTLGTDTTGNYIATISGTSNEINVTGSGTENATVTLSLPSNMVIPQDLTITGDLTVQGTTIINDTNTIEVADPYVTVGGINGLQFDDNKDRGVRFKWHDGTADVTAGSFVIGESYIITSIGTTDFTAIGAASNTVGEDFTATGVGSGTGTANNLDNTHVGFFGYDDNTQCFTYITDAIETGGVFSGTKGCLDVGSVIVDTTVTGDLIGNADTATALETARTIGGVSFDGTANINLPGVNITGNQDTTGNADTATALETARTITLGGDLSGSTSFDGTSNVTITASVANDSHSHDTQYYTKSLSDLRYINITGDTMTGDLTLSGDPTANLHAVTKQYVDNGFLEISGGTLTGALTLSGDPTANLHAVTKQYVDGEFLYRSGGTLYGNLSISGSSPVLSIDDTNSGSGGGQTGYILFTNTGSETFRIGDWNPVSEVGGPDVLRFRNINGTSSIFEFGSDGLTSGNLYVGSDKVFNDGYHPNADKWTTARTLSLTGAVTGSVSIDGSGNVSLATTHTADPTITLTGDVTGSATMTNLSSVSITATVANDSHTHDGRYYTETEADARFVNTAGDTLTGALTLSGNPTANLHAAPKQYVDTQISSGTVASAAKWTTARTITLGGDLSGSVSIDGSANVTLSAQVANDSHSHSNYLTLTGGTMTGPISLPNPTQDAHAVNRIYLSNNFINKTGGTMTGLLTLSGNPTVNNHAATKIYVDTAISNVTGGSVDYATEAGNADTADKWTTARTITLTGDVSGSVSIDGSSNVSITTTVADDSHFHSNYYTMTTADNRFMHRTADDTFTGKLSVGSTSSRQAGMYGIYDSTKTGHIWSMGTAYAISATGVDFGNLYGFGYKHTNNATGGTMADGHQAVWCQNGTPNAALGTNIWTSGDVTAYSDARVKTNLEKIDNAVDKVLQLNGYTFERTDKDDNGKRYAGVIAQEVLEVLPEVVTGGPTDEDPDGHYSVAYGNIVALLIEGMKEQQSQIEALKSEIAKLKDK